MKWMIAFALAVLATTAGAAPPASQARAVFAMGCFWCAEAAYEGRPGVIRVTSGYTGGTTTKPVYETAHDFGHVEAIEVIYDPAKTKYEDLLYIFWRNVDPVSANGQFCDRGPQYRSIIFAVTPEQKAAAEASKSVLEKSGRFRQPIATEILAAKPFYPAEDYHQDYAVKNQLKYEYYRYGCGRDARLDEVWGAEARAGAKH